MLKNFAITPVCFGIFYWYMQCQYQWSIQVLGTPLLVNSALHMSVKSRQRIWMLAAAAY
ncbi:hypothetical protein Hamer_G024237 [Homarus americanus]|uniref:Uncharacterized protein n=1 Tax=Homarus americanus TaxID=6706 RepID=A0A8J5JRY8_HOMAM|nr:hypothetical protein Hamer_G024237 [Homarus americanus]